MHCETCTAWPPLYKVLTGSRPPAASWSSCRPGKARTPSETLHSHTSSARAEPVGFAGTCAAWISPKRGRVGAFPKPWTPGPCTSRLSSGNSSEAARFLKLSHMKLSACLSELSRQKSRQSPPILFVTTSLVLETSPEQR